MKNYKVVLTIDYPHHTEYVIWEPEMLGVMLYKGVDLYKLFYETKPSPMQNADAPVNVLIELYEDPQVKEIIQRIEDKEVQMQILIGTKILPIRNV